MKEPKIGDVWFRAECYKFFERMPQPCIERWRVVRITPKCLMLKHHRCTKIKRVHKGAKRQFARPTIEDAARDLLVRTLRWGEHIERSRQAQQRQMIAANEFAESVGIELRINDEGIYMEGEK